MTDETTTRTEGRSPAKAHTQAPDVAARANGEPDRDAPPRTDETPDVPGAGASSILTDYDIYLFNEGSHVRLWEKLGAHVREVDGQVGVHFAVWAPNAEYVSVIGDFNGWDKGSHEMAARGSSGVWERFIPEVGKGDNYKFHIRSRNEGYTVDKADPFAVHAETPPYTGSKIWDLDYEWSDDDWMAERGERQDLTQPMSIYELHVGSWRRLPEQDDRPLNYREMAEPLVDHVTELGFTHVEFLPVMEHPFGGSWGYQTTGYFAPTARHGHPTDLMALIDHLHQRGIGVLL
ncbi:MAG: hypothetical protein R3320_13890, partial [Nitriliruptorales bacterium]|nr:hypothetical protein [Nitriliruptorales bacterium]